ncbi:hypothetical protein [Streptomyces spectabilis]|uniref:Uncharacterized protein n=1 Tax=Streptomyces spectabilis TaxID=68270 RepID=A0A7W8B367_STRST|nr:hypothetical protein [Streptomyces spectabilis]MBB5109471.1 hypothetical protein [Streptomyces spectabilis]MCI3907818.1 hypothetical protein [Streptomyces spectabilis]GGV53418.1 hypothetical protein GCM10010245_84290 [Streptomyces spectabilis]
MKAPRRVTPRRLGAAVVLAAVFTSGWLLGQPLKPEGCEWEEILKRQSQSGEPLLAVGVTGCDERPRIKAWFEGDWR